MLPEAHKLALFKRCISLIGGKNKVYLRLPSEDPEAEILEFQDDEIAKDWLKSEHKPYLNSHKNGKDEKYTGYDDLVASEAQWVKGIMAEAEAKAAANTKPEAPGIMSRGRVLPDSPDNSPESNRTRA